MRTQIQFEIKLLRIITFYPRFQIVYAWATIGCLPFIGHSLGLQRQSDRFPLDWKYLRVEQNIFLQVFQVIPNKTHVFIE